MLKNQNYEKAKHYLYLAYRYLSKYGENKSLIYFITHNNLAHIYNRTFDFQKAIILIEDFLKLNNNLTYKIVMPYLHIAANVAYFEIGDYDAAIKHIKKSILLFSYEEDKHNIGRCYINYINALRYSSAFPEAFNIIEYCKKEYVDDKYLLYKFLMQEITLYFNIENYDKVIELANNINFNNLPKMGKSNYQFMLGHINFLKGDFKKAHSLLIKCEKFYIDRNYSYDLSILYSDLYEITNDNIYLEKSLKYKDLMGRKNIFII